MKKVLLFALFLAIAAVGLDAATGKLGILPSAHGSAASDELRAMEGRFNAAKRQVNQAMRGAGLSGLDTTGDIEAARKELVALHSEVTTFLRQATAEEAREDAQRLEAAIKQYRSEMNW